MLGLRPRITRRYAMALTAATAAVAMTVSSVPASAVTVTAPASTAQRHVKLGPLLTLAQAERQSAAHPNTIYGYAICLWNDDTACLTIQNVDKNGVVDWVGVVEGAIGIAVSIWGIIKASGSSDKDENEGNSDGDDDYEGWFLGSPGYSTIGVGSESVDGTYWEFPTSPNGGNRIWNTEQHEYITTNNPAFGSAINLSPLTGWSSWGFRAYGT